MYQPFHTKRLKGKNSELEHLLQELHTYKVISGEIEIPEVQYLKPYLKKNHINKKDINVNLNTNLSNDIDSSMAKNENDNLDTNMSDDESDIQDMFGFSLVKKNENSNINEPTSLAEPKESLLSKLNLPKLNEEKYNTYIPSEELSEPVIYPLKPLYISSLHNDKKRKHEELYVEKVWHPKNNKFIDLEKSNLITTACNICKKTGHMAEDCKYKQSINNTIHPILRNIYTRCKPLKTKTDAQCFTCSSKFNLVQCMDCNTVWCDDKNHLIDHLKSYSSHTTLFSFKLRKIIKCSNPTCKEMNIYKLLGCAPCLENIREKYYNFHTASWKSKGLYFVTNAISCSKHFQWHLTNCLRSEISETIANRKRIEEHLYTDGQLNEYLF